MTTLHADDRRAARTFDRAAELWMVHGPDQEVVRLGVAADEERLRGRRGADLEPVTVELLQRWWEEGLFRQAGSRLVPIRSPGKQVVEDARRRRLEEAAGDRLKVYDRAVEKLKQRPGQFDDVAAELRRDKAISDPPTAETLAAWWKLGLWVRDPGGSREEQPCRPPIVDVVSNHIALHEQQADHAAATFRRENKYSTARNGRTAVDVLDQQMALIRLQGRAFVGDPDRPGLARVGLQLMQSLADDLSKAEDRGGMSMDKKHEWIVRIDRLMGTFQQRLQGIINAQTVLGGGDRTLVLGIATGPTATTTEQPAAALDASTAAELAERARELAENMESVSRLPEALDQALETEVSRPG